MGWTEIGKVEHLLIYPVKACHGCALPRMTFDRAGPVNDRRWLLVDDQGRFVTQRQVPALASVVCTMADDHLHVSHPLHDELVVAQPGPSSPHKPVTIWKRAGVGRDAGEEAARWFSEIVGSLTRLVFMPPDKPVLAEYQGREFAVSFADSHPVLVTTTASLRDLNGRLNESIPMARFRPNLVVDGQTPYDEDHWRVVQVGDVLLTSPKPCRRCIVTTIDQDQGVVTGKEPMRTLRSFRRDAKGVVFGRYFVVERPGTATVGDPVLVQ